MEKETVKISLKPRTIIYFLLGAGALLFFVLTFEKDSSKKEFSDESKEIVPPVDFGVADSGFEGKITSFTALNAKVSLDDRYKIDGTGSLKISFSDQPIASVKIADYFNEISEDKYYRLSLWAMSDAVKNKEIFVRIAGNEKNQELGKINLERDGGIEYSEFLFQAEDDFADLIFIATDAASGNVWLDNISVEPLNVESSKDLKNIRPTVFGSTTWKNVSQAFNNEGADSGDFLSKAGRKIGQVFHPSSEMFSGAALKIRRHGTGGTGLYLLQIRELDEKTGVVSEEALASTFINHDPGSGIIEEIAKREEQMRKDFARREEDIAEGKIKNDRTEDHYPETFTQEQINAAKAAKRKAQLELAVRDMKESFNAIEEVEIPLAAKLDPNKKYWLGVDNTNVKVDGDNYISVAMAGLSVTSKGIESGLTGEAVGFWESSPSLWLKIFYPIHRKIDGQDIASGATISDLGNGKLVYRYQFFSSDYDSSSGIFGRIIYDMAEGNYGNINTHGNYGFSDEEEYATYRLNTLYPSRKIILRNIQYNQSLAIDFSSDGESWEEIFSDNPAENNQTADPVVFEPKEAGNAFFLRFRSGGNESAPLGLSVEAELEDKK